MIISGNRVPSSRGATRPMKKQAAPTPTQATAKTRRERETGLVPRAAEGRVDRTELSEIKGVARGMTAQDVGSSAWLGLLLVRGRPSNSPAALREILFELSFRLH